MNAPLLAVDNLSIVRAETTLLDQVSWRVRPGEHWVVLGANGSGKTSLLRALTGYLTASSGDIQLLGKRYGECDWRDLRERVGLVSSALQASIPPGEPLLDTVISGKYAQLDLWVDPSEADRRAARKWLRTVKLKIPEDRPWLFLSQGERQRVLIARALMARPDLLILDEPCAGLDPVSREHFLRVFDELASHRGGPALVLVTHHVEEIMPVFTHALLLRGGKVVAAGPREDVLTTALLGETFGAPVKLGRHHGRLTLRVAHA
ncbi:MAG: ABC transporter ATP-binding protein [Verrucomicrobiota bacterium]